MHCGCYQIACSYGKRLAKDVAKTPDYEGEPGRRRREDRGEQDANASPQLPLATMGAKGRGGNGEVAGARSREQKAVRGALEDELQ